MCVNLANELGHHLEEFLIEARKNPNSLPPRHSDYTRWLFNIAMENGLFLIGKSLNNIYKWTIFHGYVK